ncbi:hypothetical protein Lesp02_23730 [Lentzea sp. NBRC 105346]|nr:hypothetical protein Lesp02_23730 [Lentzea sp. NBRC 105346]
MRWRAAWGSLASHRESSFPAPGPYVLTCGFYVPVARASRIVWRESYVPDPRAVRSQARPRESYVPAP